MVSRICAWRASLAAIALLLAQPTAAATTARVDRTKLSVNESFQVVFKTDQDVTTTPDFSPLEQDFDVLGTAQSTSINVVNGQMQRSISWVVDLMPKRDGALVVPAIDIGGERSNVIELAVRAADSADAAGGPADILLEAAVDQSSPYVQGQVVLTVRLLRSVPISGASLTDPRVTGGDVLIEKLGDDLGYETERDGVRLAVIERRYALFAQSSGSFVIEPFVFEGRVTENRRFGFDPFARGRAVRARSGPITLEVRPIPAAFSGSAWLPAEQLMLVEKAPEGQGDYRAGEPITRILTLQATGLTSSQLPEIDVPAVPGVRRYPDQPALENRTSSDGIVAIRQQKMALIPSRAGTLTLPAIALPWWNTRTDRLEYARLPARSIEVLPARGATASDPVPEPAPVAAATEPASEQVPGVPVAGTSAASSLWPWLSLALAIGWGVTGLGWIITRRRRARRAPKAESRPNEKSLRQAIRRACDAGDASAAKDALLSWAQGQWPGSRVRSLGDLAARLGGDLQDQIHRLSRQLYQAQAADWDGAGLWRAFAAWQQDKRPPRSPATPEMEPLYLHTKP